MHSSMQVLTFVGLSRPCPVCGSNTLAEAKKQLTVCDKQIAKIQVRET